LRRSEIADASPSWPAVYRRIPPRLPARGRGTHHTRPDLLNADLELHPDDDHGARLALTGSYSNPYFTDRAVPGHPEQRQALHTAAQTLLHHCAATLTATAD
jgi:hypothetical protein